MTYSRRGEETLCEMDAAAHVLRNEDIQAQSCIIAERRSVGAMLLRRSCPGISTKPTGLKTHLIGFRLRGGRTSRCDKPRHFPGRCGSPGMTAFVAAEEGSVWNSHGPHEMAILFIDSIFFSKVASESVGLDARDIQFRDAAFRYDKYAEHLGRMLELRLKQADPILESELEGWAIGAILHAVRNFTTVGPSRAVPKIGRLSPAKLELAFEYINSQLGMPLQIRNVADAVDVEPCSLARSIKQETGKTLHQYVIDLRIRRAKQLLANAELSISQIAQQLGFADQSHLTNRFKAVCGMTPGRFRAVAGVGAEADRG